MLNRPAKVFEPTWSMPQALKAQLPQAYHQVKTTTDVKLQVFLREDGMLAFYGCIQDGFQRPPKHPFVPLGAAQTQDEVDDQYKFICLVSIFHIVAIVLLDGSSKRNQQIFTLYAQLELLSQSSELVLHLWDKAHTIARDNTVSNWWFNNRSDSDNRLLTERHQKATALGAKLTQHELKRFRERQAAARAAQVVQLKAQVRQMTQALSSLLSSEQMLVSQQEEAQAEREEAQAKQEEAQVEELEVEDVHVDQKANSLFRCHKRNQQIFTLYAQLELLSQSSELVLHLWDKAHTIARDNTVSNWWFNNRSDSDNRLLTERHQKATALGAKLTQHELKRFRERQAAARAAQVVQLKAQVRQMTQALSSLLSSEQMLVSQQEEAQAEREEAQAKQEEAQVEELEVEDVHVDQKANSLFRCQ
ncbi:hypothetical protein CBOM_07302 [Ceraceosorus bombacis]|uniref:Uncharacterized protein n=1 Tax=Ceraceosorus bombacis TaxID=401625 RepID=A0A0N7L8T9_9BASI|nr:hypothetical protein CBOM_07302 [Ceraceosorus bombacis]